MRSRSNPTLVILCSAIIFVFANAVYAQDWTLIDDDDWCDSRWNADYCEVRETTLDGRRDVIEVDAGHNGGITVRGWDRNEIRLRAKIKVWEDSRGEAREIASEIEIETRRTIRADGPSNRRGDGGWSVSFELMVPRKSDLALETNNGGISIRDVRGNIEFDATNGGVTLEGLAGAVEGKTTNGSLKVVLDGDQWDGDGLDARTTNGGVSLYLPEDYSAELVTGTVNGSMHVNFPITVQGEIGKRITTSLGDGGPRIRVTTTNGGVKIKRGRA
jgi:hypothetical protein